VDQVVVQILGDCEIEEVLSNGRIQGCLQRLRQRAPHVILRGQRGNPIPVKSFNNPYVKIEFVVAGIHRALRNGNDYVIDMTDAVVRNIQRSGQFNPEVRV
jgi:hypothetical protein